MKNLDDTTLVVELISNEVRVMSCVYEVVCQRLCHILMNLQTTNKQISQFSSYEGSTYCANEIIRFFLCVFLCYS
jgi:hypothetical protein